MAISLSFQPTANAIVFAKSPIFYKFSGCDSSQYTYVISVSATTSTFASLTEYVTINRTPDLNNNIIIDISNIIKNYIRLNFNVLGNNAAYIKVALLEYSLSTLNSSILSNVCIAVYGNTEYLDGFNKTYSTSNVYPLSSVPGKIYLPNYGGTGNTFSLSFANNEAGSYHINYYDINSGWTYGTSTNFPTVTNANTNIVTVKCGYSDIINIDVNQKMELVINHANATIAYSYWIYPDPCTGNDLHNIKFLNKWGIFDTIFIKAKIIKTSKHTSETYKYNKIDYTNMTYDQTGTYHKLYANSKTSYILNTGWISEDYNIQLEELNNSEYVYFDDIPVIVTDTEVQYKTHKFDKLINYTINVDLAYDKINNIM